MTAEKQTENQRPGLYRRVLCFYFIVLQMF